MNLKAEIPIDAVLERFNPKRLQEISDDLVGVEIFRVKCNGRVYCYAVRYFKDNQTIDVFESIKELLDYVRPEGR